MAIQLRDYPDETILVVEVEHAALTQAGAATRELDDLLAAAGVRGFATIRAAASQRANVPDQSRGRRTLLMDDAADRFSQLLESRARTSVTDPTLQYIPDATYNVSSAQGPRHHLVFGRRGAGKTALLVEAKRRIEGQGDLVVWVNLQTYRSQSPSSVFRAVCGEVATVSMGRLDGVRPQSSASKMFKQLRDAAAGKGTDEKDAKLVVDLNSALKQLYDITGHRTYLFLDDLHYVARSEQPRLLELFHGASRDANCWLKVATIKHLSKWFDPSGQTGLQLGHDAASIELDLTLQNPTEAKQFLEKVLLSHAFVVGIPRLNLIFSPDALDRLVFAAGAVPRDYLMLSADTIRKARARIQARTVGVEDVNRAAGDAAQRKITELEDDSASGTQKSKVLTALEMISKFCIDEKKYTFFRVDFSNKENHAREYAYLQALLDLRLVHLVSGSVSDPHAAGRKAEVFTLDLSRYSGDRLKKFLRVLDFVEGILVQKTTGTTERIKKGSSSRALTAILRQAPEFDLGLLSSSRIALKRKQARRSRN